MSMVWTSGDRKNASCEDVGEGDRVQNVGSVPSDVIDAASFHLSYPATVSLTGSISVLR